MQRRRGLRRGHTRTPVGVGRFARSYSGGWSNMHGFAANCHGEHRTVSNAKPGIGMVSSIVIGRHRDLSTANAVSLI